MASVEHSPARVEFLLVEDDEGDLLMLEEALAEPGAPAPPRRVHVARDGEEALAFLRRDGAFAHAPAPDLVLLDLNLPKVDGHGVLRAIKADPALVAIPVVVLSTSDAEEDVWRAYAAHANAFVTKPASYEELSAAVRALVHTFTAVATLPPRPH